jgi:hypothetical protein
MSERAVRIAVDKLLTDEGLRLRFIRNRVETLVELCLYGVDLSADEIALLCRADSRVWFQSGGRFGVRH